MKPVRRVLVIQPYGIGDLLFVTPVLRALRLLPSVECVDLMLGSRTDAVVRSNPHVDEIIPVDKDLFHRQGGLATFRDALKLGARLRKKKYDLLLDYSMRGEFGFFGKFFLGIPRRAAFAYKRRAFFHNIRVDLKNGYEKKHVAEYCAALARAAGVPVKQPHLEFYLTAEEKENSLRSLREKTGGLFKKYLVLAPGGGASWGKDAHFKQWPASEFAALAGKIRSDYAFDGVYLIGSADEKSLAEETAAQLDLPSFNLAGACTLTETAALLSGASLFLGNDGGLMHLAHTLRVPVLAVYGPVPPEIYGPWPASPRALTFVKNDLDCRPCYRKFRYKSDCSHLDCLRTLSHEEVYSEIRQKQFFRTNLKDPV